MAVLPEIVTLALDKRCPTCKAEPGVECSSKKMHVTRIDRGTSAFNARLARQEQARNGVKPAAYYVVPCSYCGAPQWETCRTPSGKPTHEHSDRVAAWESAQWLERKLTGHGIEH